MQLHEAISVVENVLSENVGEFLPKIIKRNQAMNKGRVSDLEFMGDFTAYDLDNSFDQIEGSVDHEKFHRDARDTFYPLMKYAFLLPADAQSKVALILKGLEDAYSDRDFAHYGLKKTRRTLVSNAEIERQKDDYFGDKDETRRAISHGKILKIVGKIKGEYTKALKTVEMMRKAKLIRNLSMSDLKS